MENNPLNKPEEPILEESNYLEEEKQLQEVQPGLVEETEPIIKPVEEIPIIQNLSEEGSLTNKTATSKKRTRCSKGKHRSKKNRCKKITTIPSTSKCPPGTFRSSISHRCRKKCSKNHRYNKSKKRCVRKKNI